MAKFRFEAGFLTGFFTALAGVALGAAVYNLAESWDSAKDAVALEKFANGEDVKAELEAQTDAEKVELALDKTKAGIDAVDERMEVEHEERKAAALAALGSVSAVLALAFSIRRK